MCVWSVVVIHTYLGLQNVFIWMSVVSMACILHNSLIAIVSSTREPLTFCDASLQMKHTSPVLHVSIDPGPKLQTSELYSVGHMLSSAVRSRSGWAFEHEKHFWGASPKNEDLQCHAHSYFSNDYNEQQRISLGGSVVVLSHISLYLYILLSKMNYSVPHWNSMWTAFRWNTPNVKWMVINVVP